MIAFISGLVIRTEGNAVVVNSGGIGYLVNVIPNVSLAAKVGEEMQLHTELIVREDAQTLFGFGTVQELTIFQMLLKVSGVGPKSALAVLGTLDVAAIQAAVATDDDEAFRTVPGVGPKTAKLICVQLAGRLGIMSSATGSRQSELVDALTGLGYSSKAALEAVKQSNAGELALSEGLRVALASLSRKGSE